MAHADELVRVDVCGHLGCRSVGVIQSLELLRESSAPVDLESRIRSLILRSLVHVDPAHVERAEVRDLDLWSHRHELAGLLLLNCDLCGVAFRRLRLDRWNS